MESIQWEQFVPRADHLKFIAKFESWSKQQQTAAFNSVEYRQYREYKDNISLRNDNLQLLQISRSTRTLNDRHECVNWLNLLQPFNRLFGYRDNNFCILVDKLFVYDTLTFPPIPGVKLSSNLWQVKCDLFLLEIMKDYMQQAKLNQIKFEEDKWNKKLRTNQQQKRDFQNGLFPLHKHLTETERFDFKEEIIEAVSKTKGAEYLNASMIAMMNTTDKTIGIQTYKYQKGKDPELYVDMVENEFLKLHSFLKKRCKWFVKNQELLHLRYKNEIYLSYLKYYVNLRWLHHFNTHMSYMYHNYVCEIANVRASFRVEVTTKINLFQQLADERSEQRLELKELAEAGDAKAIAKREKQREQTRDRVKRHRANHHV
jgi:hypothetical protein